MSSKGKQQRTEEQQEYAERAFNAFRDESWKRQLSNTENYDKSILTLSSGGLVISLTFLRFLVPEDGASHMWLIATSWICFLLTITMSLIAYRISNSAITEQIKIAEKYYIEQDETAYNQDNKKTIINRRLNNCVGLTFFAAMLMLVLFVIFNLISKEVVMTDKKTQIDESAEAPTMQKVPKQPDYVEHSAEPPDMAKVPTKPAPVQPKEGDTEKK